MRTRVLIAFTAFVCLLIAAAWTVSVRTRQQSSLVDDPLASPFADVATDGSSLPVLTQAMPEFTGIEAWLNSGALTAEELKGKVVLIDFWTYSCINCIRTLPYVTAWHEKYKEKGFSVIGVHTPEFAFEKEEDNVREAIERHGIGYPVALDNDYATWDNYSNQYWPAHYLFDAHGRLRFVHFGEGRYDETERNIQALLKEAGRDAEMAVTEAGREVDFAKIGTPETYLGYARMERLGSPEAVVRDGETVYTAPEELSQGKFYLSGAWRVEAERSVAGANARILYRFNASNANLVIAPPAGKRARVEVLLDNAPVPEGYRGADVTLGPDGKTYATIDEETLYELIYSPGKYERHLLEIRFPDAGTSAYAFTFG